MNRRDAMLTTGSMFVSASLGALACGGSPAIAQNAQLAPHSHHHGDPALFEAAQACLAKGQACLAHCIALLGAGDTSMAGCAQATHDMHAMMVGLAAAASTGSKHLAQVARVAAEFCKDCEQECKKHADKHAACKECGEACARTAAACARVAG